MKTILFVCTGNLCRSPMAEALLRRKLEREGRADIRVESAGVWTDDGLPAATGSALAMERRGISLDAHRSRMVTAAILDSADLILTMTESHAEALRVEFPAVAPRVHLLADLSGRRRDIADPIGGSLADYERTASELEKLIEQIYPRILEYLGAEP